MLREDERRALTGFPGAKNVPLLRDLFSSNEKTISQTDIVMLLTPHIIRSTEITVDDLKPIYIGSQGSLGLNGPPPLIGPENDQFAAPQPAPAPPPGQQVPGGVIIAPPGTSPVPGTIFIPTPPPTSSAVPGAFPQPPAPAAAASQPNSAPRQVAPPAEQMAQGLGSAQVIVTPS